MYIPRDNQLDFFTSFEGPLISALLGPRRVGKTTLIEHYIDTHPEQTWVKFNMDEKKQRQRIANHELMLMIEESSLQKIGDKDKIWVVVEEAQKCPELFDQVKRLYDQFHQKDKIKFILIGSAHLNLHQSPLETLSGRIDFLRLREFTLSETTRLLSKEHVPLAKSAFHAIFNSQNIDSLQEYYLSLRQFQQILTKGLEQQLLWGGLPEILQTESEKQRIKYLGTYIQTYLEKDIREISTINDLTLYENLIKVIAEQTGSIKDEQRIINALECSRNTMQKYQEYLISTWQYVEVEPFIKKTPKRVVKSPKRYLRNNGLISYFTGIKDLPILKQTGLLEYRFENWFLNQLGSYMDPIGDYYKAYFWKTHSGQEVDFVVQVREKLIPFGFTYSSQIIRRKIHNLKVFLEDNPQANFAVYLYQGPMKFDQKDRILFLPVWMI